MHAHCTYYNYIKNIIYFQKKYIYMWSKLLRIHAVQRHCQSCPASNLLSI